MPTVAQTTDPNPQHRASDSENESRSVPATTHIPGEAGPRRRRQPRARKRRDRILLFSRAFAPDPFDAGLRAADVAEALARRGYRVRVYTANAPRDRHWSAEAALPAGVEVRRLPLTRALGTGGLARWVGFGSFVVQSLLRGLFLPNVAGVIVGASPPLIGAVATVLRMFRGMPVVYWATDLSPDYLADEGAVVRGSMMDRVLHSIDRTILQNAALVIAADRYMAERLYDRGRLDDKLVVIPPWPTGDARAAASSLTADSFRRERGIAASDLLLVHCGNQEPLSAMQTFMEAVQQLRDRDGLRFAFVAEAQRAESLRGWFSACGLDNVICIARQAGNPLLRVLASADVVCISTPSGLVGVRHPPDAYAAWALARPVVAVAPTCSPVGELLERFEAGIRVDEDDVAGVVRAVETLAAMSPDQRAAIGERGRQQIAKRFSRPALCSRFCDGLELALEKRT